MAIADKLYTGKEIVNKPVVKYGTVTLKENVDYSLVYKYEDESKKGKTGRVNIDIRFIGNFEGTAICPELVVKVNKTDADILKLNDDYEIDWSNNINVGTATIIIKCMGSYEKYTKTKVITSQFTTDSSSSSISMLNTSLGSCLLLNLLPPHNIRTRKN